MSTYQFDGPVAPAFPLHAGSTKSLLLEGFKAHSIYALLIALYWSSFYLVASGHGGTPANFLVRTATFAAIFSFVGILSYLPYRFYRMAVHVRPESPLRYFAKDLVSFFTDPRRVALGVPMFVVMCFFMTIFTDFKSTIPRIAPFSWDVTFAQWDRFLHFGVDPWRLLQPFLGYAPVTFVINFVYNFWFFIMWMFQVHIAFSKETSVLRTRFFLSFMLTWAIGGSYLATVFSSAGPCYFGRLGLGPGLFSNLMAYLNSANEIFPVWALNIQDKLWHAHVHGGAILGISAMPSMHNATALLLVCAGWNMGRLLRWLLILHCVFVFIGSIHLGWHYAIDAYAGWPIALLAWGLAAPLARWWESRSQVRRFAAALDSIGPR